MNVSEDLGTTMILEGDRIRIWEHRVAPGTTGPMHLHRRPYFTVVVVGTSGDALDLEGNVSEHITFTPGAVLPAREDSLPQTHALRNTGDDEILLITTELL